MPVYKLDRFEVRADARLAAERAMFDYASYVRAELPDSIWTMYRDLHAPTRFTSITVSRDAAAEARALAAPGTRTFLAAIEPVLVGAIETSASELVTSSDLARRHRPDARRARRR
jgi:hypothetical protein